MQTKGLHIWEIFRQVQLNKHAERTQFSRCTAISGFCEVWMVQVDMAEDLKGSHCSLEARQGALGHPQNL